ncbi:MAG: cell division protein SepF, partial [Ruminiclostridium sp.]|nr:cell division protein SepF [Ruminiclostridium sp.]
KDLFFNKNNEDEEYDTYDEADVATARADTRPSSQVGSKVFTFNASTTLHLVVNRPKKYSDAAEIAELYKNKTTVILMFNNTNKDIANRLIDFLGGVSYITDGELKRIGDTTYVLAPYNVDISGDFIEEINNISGGEDIFDSLD